MSFWEEYKRLDNLCKDLLGSDKGVTSYIEEMEKASVFCQERRTAEERKTSTTATEQS